MDKRGSESALLLCNLFTGVNNLDEYIFELVVIEVVEFSLDSLSPRVWFRQTLDLYYSFHMV